MSSCWQICKYVRIPLKQWYIQETSSVISQSDYLINALDALAGFIKSYQDNGYNCFEYPIGIREGFYN